MCGVLDEKLIPDSCTASFSLTKSTTISKYDVSVASVLVVLLVYLLYKLYEDLTGRKWKDEKLIPSNIMSSVADYQPEAKREAILIRENREEYIYKHGHSLLGGKQILSKKRGS